MPWERHYSTSKSHCSFYPGIGGLLTVWGFEAPESQSQFQRFGQQVATSPFPSLPRFPWCWTSPPVWGQEILPAGTSKRLSEKNSQQGARKPIKNRRRRRKINTLHFSVGKHASKMRFPASLRLSTLCLTTPRSRGTRLPPTKASLSNSAGFVNTEHISIVPVEETAWGDDDEKSQEDSQKPRSEKPLSK